MIISASTRTDIPAFYSNWLLKRIKEGYVLVRNPYNARQVTKYVLDPDTVDAMLLWTKNPIPLLSRIDELKPFHPYFFVTITPYGREIEPYVPDKKKILESTIQLAKTLGKDSVCLRYDPILLTERYTIETHAKAFRYIAEAISGVIGEVVISFLDVYEKTKRNFKEGRALTCQEQRQIAKVFSEIAKEYGITIKTCAEEIDLTAFGIKNSGCVSKETMERHLGGSIKEKKHPPERENCMCMETKDIGAYHSCLHGCRYCYANANHEVALTNYKKHNENSPFLIGELTKDDVIKEAKQVSFFDGQIRLDFIE